MKRLVTAAVGAAALLGVSVSSASAATFTASFDSTFPGWSVMFTDNNNNMLLDFDEITPGTFTGFSLLGSWDGLIGIANSAGSVCGGASSPLNCNAFIFTSTSSDTDLTMFPGDDARFSVSGLSPVPLPAGAWLLLSALGGLGFAGWRRKRTLAA